MVFEKLGTLRYHGLWAYAALIGIFVGLDKIPVDSIESAALLLAPIALVITADIAKYAKKQAKE